MKTSGFSLALTLSLAVVPAIGQQTRRPAADRTPEIGERVVVERGAHHRTYHHARAEALPDGTLQTNVSSYTELASGLHRWDARSQQWVGAEAKLEIAGSTAVGRSAAHQVTLANNANTAGAVELITPDGKRLRSHILGLAFFDASTGQSEMFASLKDSIGELHDPNVVIYTDAFDGVKADIRYSYRRGNFEQDVILRERHSLPSGYNPETTSLEVWTEFIEVPTPTIRTTTRRGVKDETLDFGKMKTGAGQAFALGQPINRRRGAPVAKRWLTVDGRTFLIEAVRYSLVKEELDKLPVPGTAVLKLRNTSVPLAALAQTVPGNFVPQEVRSFPPAPPANSKFPMERFRTAAVSGQAVQGNTNIAQLTQDIVRNAGLAVAKHFRPGDKGAGLVLDYIIGSSLENFTFQADTTYWVTDYTTLDGTTTFEGGTVIKYAHTNYSILDISGPVVCKTDAYRPAIFTVQSDGSVGQIIDNTTGPTNFYQALGISRSDADLKHIRISYADTALHTFGFRLSHSQFTHCNMALYTEWGSCWMENVLMYDIGTAFHGTEYIAGATHLTLHKCVTMNADYGDPGTSSIALTNSLLVGVETNGQVMYTTHATQLLAEDAAIFQTVGAGAHYLAADSPYRDTGMPLSGTLSNDLRKLTTHPPIVLSNTITTNTVLSPQAQRDTNAPDLGFHYPPIDYAVGWLAVSNSTLTLTGGVVVATFNSTGFWLQSNSCLVSIGSPALRNTIVRYNLVQELPIRWGSWSTYTMFIPTYARELNMRFTDISLPRENGIGIYVAGGLTNLTLRDCSVGSGEVQLMGGGSNNVFYMTNCLFNRAFVVFNGYSQIIAVNNLFYGGFLGLDQYGVQTGWVLRNNIFDTVTLDDLNEYATLDHNAYVGGTTPIYPGTNATDKVVASITYQAGPLGRFYLPTNSVLINAGNTNANLLGFYHYTTTTNQVKEAATRLDIGLHYIAVNSSGQPIDTDGDGLADYVEDANGDSIQDTNETNLSNSDTDGDGLTDHEEIVVLKRSTNPLLPDTNGNGVSDAKEDTDHDLLSNLAELRRYHTDPMDNYSIARKTPGLLIPAGSPPTPGGVSTDGHCLTAAEAETQGYLATLNYDPLTPLTGFIHLRLTRAINVDANSSYDIYGSDNVLNTENNRLLSKGAPGEIDYYVPIPTGVSGKFSAGIATDTDGDGLNDGFEVLVTRTCIDTPEPDSDGDGLPDGYEIHVTGTDPNLQDTGATGVLDGDKDADGDGWSNLDEMRNRTNPNLGSITGLQVFTPLK